MTITLDQVRRRIEVAKQGDSLLQQFAQALFDKADSEFMGSFDSDSLVAMASAGLRRIRRPPDEAMFVRVFNPSFQADGWEAPYTVVELGLRDRPFIVDSVRAELRRRNYEIVHLLHPILRLEYQNGVLQSVNQQGKDLFAYELYFISREDDASARDELAQALQRVLGDVILATDAYGAMRQKAQALAAYLHSLRERSAQGVHRHQAEELEEYAAFIRWLDDDNFVFLGYREYDIFPIDDEPHLQTTPGSGLGILSKESRSAYTKPVPVRTIPDGLRERVTGGRILIVTKTNAESTVHRPARMDYIGVKKMGSSWEVLGEQRFVGLFTSKALSTPVEDIPILRLKLRQVLELDNAVPGSHDYKLLTSIFNSMPREELFWSDARALHEAIRTVMSLEQERGVRLSFRSDPLGRGIAVMVMMPRDRFNAEVRRAIQTFLQRELQASHVDYQLAMGEDESQLRFHFFFTTSRQLSDVDTARLERDVYELTLTWDDHLLRRLTQLYGEATGKKLAQKYAPAFDEAYKADITVAEALRDIEHFEALSECDYRIDILNTPDDRRREDTTLLKIYHKEQTLVLSSVMPILENLGFKVLEQIAYHAYLREVHTLGVDMFRIQDRNGVMIDVREHGERLTAALIDLLERRAENDRLNELVLYGRLTIRQVALLRSYQMYYAQLNAVTSRSFINTTLLHHPAIAARIVEAFTIKFDPAYRGERAADYAVCQEAFFEMLDDVSSLPEDTALRGLFNLVDATVRTNYFRDKPVISFKLESARVASMPEPRPLYEIAVCGLGVEGTHLRGGKVARGGIRWSDRSDDFRTEILGLMKTQMTKNAVIVPVGSKGGFVVKHEPEGREALRSYVETQYQAYIRALLDLTDNLVEGAVKHPEGLVIYDDADPYLVVAADKGTATFSDLANAIAQEYDFWLGDAFASGGSYGYDHKKEGITARGAWQCVSRHFRELGVNVHKDPFSVVGIGDMSGDVFGNGMLYTDKIKLVAAFNHLHIFLDPDPDPKVSYAERRRLFELPRSSWRDYNPELISAGGGVFERSAKVIRLSPQIQALLKLDKSEMSGQELIRHILRAPVDLLWNGGIGTYIKASSETHTEVGDASNDGVRIDASELRARVVGEGGNLGLTQLARVQFAQAGGRINTDAIDNSGGVDMSDHEVNIKIMLQPLVTAGELSLVQRNRLLEEMTDDVSQLVLKNNYFQSLALSIAERRSRRDLLLFESLMEYLTEKGGLDPKVEFLPSRKQLQERLKVGEGFTRPELAILMAYSKMGMYRRLLETDFTDEAAFEHYLYAYFPKVLGERYKSALKAHKLRREIIATQFTNTVVDNLGITFVHRSMRDTGATAVEVIRAALIAIELLEMPTLFASIFALDNEIDSSVQYSALEEIVKAVEGIVQWMLLSDQRLTTVDTFIQTYRKPLRQIRNQLKSYLSAAEAARFSESLARWQADGLPESLAEDISSMDYLPSSVGIIEVARALQLELERVATPFYALGERFAFGWLRDSLAQLPATSKWDKIACGSLIMELRQTQRKLTAAFVRQADVTLEDFVATHPRLVERFDEALRDVKANAALGLASAGVLSRMLAQLAEAFAG
jgi:glutamate dehydrogenase